ncbi:glycosyltransferase family 4 protein [Daejeonella lutea]|nr:glycosyltransferase family 4 protein [Daejeonella lutea]
MKVNIILPFVATKPIGGIKIMYQYANELAKRNHLVTIYHSATRYERPNFLPVALRVLLFKLKNQEKPSWFQFHESVESRIVADVTNSTIKDGDVVFSTWWGLAFMVDKLSPSKGNKFNLIQDYEIWKGNTELVHQSYHLPSVHLVIARYLSKLLEDVSGKRPLYLPNAIDLDKFKIEIDPEKRSDATICMLYSEEPRKGTSFGMDALYKLKKLRSDLKIELFSIFKNPGNLPEWITFNYKPTDLRALYNRNAIFFSPSLGEGWALPPAEAMACGCAVVCTDIGGHHDYSIDGETVLLVQVKNPEDMTEKLLKLIEDRERRLSISRNGTNFLLDNFNWQLSVNLLEEYFEKYS